MRSNNWFGWLIGLVILVFFFRYIIGGVLFVAFMAFLIGLIVKSVKSGQKRVKVKMSRILGEDEIRRMNRALSEYFASNNKLQIREGLYLRPATDRFTDVDDLHLCLGEEEISTLKGFGDVNRGDYRQLFREMEAILGITGGKRRPDPAPVKEPEVQPAEVPAAVQTRAEKFIEEIERINSNIPDTEITAGLVETVRLLRPLDLIERSASAGSPKLDKLYEYYLPILVSILKKYDELSKRDFGSPDFNEAKEKLSKTIALINEALRNINLSFSEGALLDMSTDIYTLQAILKKDGMVSDAMDMGRFARSGASRSEELAAAESPAAAEAPETAAEPVANVDELALELEEDELIDKPEMQLGKQ